eukprot:TRINITY_DN5615_c0_g1_i1.p1 TRINITY_DN5615_c0_g1~~TRINITY_DN5615_c0_g1_i1.p1  ORF type:complete len:1138 (-),score=283.33 TRINITY_DN5615_c0_g1_i1:50-3463(-)
MAMNSTPCFATQRVRVCRQLFTDEEFVEMCEFIRQNGATIVDKSDYDTFHLVQYFSGDEFEELHEKGYPLIAAPCVYDSLKLQKPLPKMESASQGPGKYHPIFSRALEGVVMYIDAGFRPAVRDTMSALARLMNAKHVPLMTSEVTHLFADTVRSDAYQTAAALGIKILRPQWLFERWSTTGDVLDDRGYVLECFAGLTLCVTGVEVEKRSEIKSLTVAHGGEFSAALDRSCTHLLAETGSSMKVQFAVAKLNIPILHTDWFFKSIEKGYALPEEKFVIQAAKNQFASLAPSQLRQSQLTVQSYFSADNSKDLLTPPASSAISNISSLMPATQRDLVQKYKNATPYPSQVTQYTAQKSITASQPVIKSVTESEKRPLVDCSLYLCGFTDEMSELFQNMVRQMGGKCIDLAVDHMSNVTHVVIGDSSKSQLRTISRLLTMRSKPLVVVKQWVEECYRIHARLSEMAYVFNIQEHLDVGPIDLSADHVPPKTAEPVQVPRNVPSQTSNIFVPSQTQGSSRTTAASTPQKNPLSHSGQILMGPPKNKFVTAASDFKTVISKPGKGKADSLVEAAQTMRRVLAAPVGLEPLADSVEQNTGSENTGDDVRQFKSKKTPVKKKAVPPSKTKPRVSSSSSESLSDEFMFQPPRSSKTSNKTPADSSFVPGALMHFEPEKTRASNVKQKSPKKKPQARSIVPLIETPKNSEDRKRPRPTEHKIKQASPPKKKKLDPSEAVVRQPALERKDSEPISLDIEWMVTSQRLSSSSNYSEPSQALFHSQIRSQTKIERQPSQRPHIAAESVPEYHGQDVYEAEDQMEYQEDMYNEQELPIEEEYGNEIPVAADLQEPDAQGEQEGAFFPTPYDTKHNDLNKSLTIDVNNPTSAHPNALQFEDGEEQAAEQDEDMDDNEYEEELIGESSPQLLQRHDDQSDAEKTHSIDEGGDAEQVNYSSQVSVHGYPIITNIAPNKGPANGGTLVFVYCDGCQDRDKYLQIKVAFGDHIAKTTFDTEKNCYWAITPALDFLPNDPDLLSVPVYLVFTDPQKEVQELVWNPPGKQFYYQFRREGVQTAPVKDEQPLPQWSARQISDIAAKQKQRLEQYAHALRLNSKREAWLERLFEMEKDMNVLFTCLTQLVEQKENHN